MVLPASLHKQIPVKSRPSGSVLGHMSPCDWVNVGEIVLWIKVMIATKPDGLGLIPLKTHVVERQKLTPTSRPLSST